MTDTVCMDFLHDPATPWWGITLLVVSNFGFALTSIKAYYHRFYFQSAIYLSVLFVSSFYHACKPTNGWCILPFFILYSYDMFFALINIPLVVHYFLPYHTPIFYWNTIPKRESTSEEDIKLVSHIPESKKPLLYDGLIGKEVIQFIFYGIIIGLLIMLEWLNIYGYLILVGLVAIEVLIIISFVRIKFGLWPLFHWGYFGTGIALLVLGAMAFIMQDFVTGSAYIYVYSIIHSLWHIVSAIGQVLLIQSRIYQPDKDILEELRSRHVDIDHLSDKDVFDITYDLYGDEKAVRDTLRFRNQQKESPWTIV